MSKRNLVIIGNGMVSHRFAEKLVEFGGLDRFEVTIFGEEPRRAYDRVHLSEYFSEKSSESLYLSPADWYRKNGIELLLSHPVISVDPKRRKVFTTKFEKDFDECIFATGSLPFVPETEGIRNQGIFVYRTIEDLDQIHEYAKNSRRTAVLGGGLLGLEAAKALLDLGKEVHVIESGSRLMPRQLDEAASSILQAKIEELGVTIHLNKMTKKILGDKKISGLEFQDNSTLDVDLLIVSAGIRPRDELAKNSGIFTGDRGGIVVDDNLHTNYYGIYAIGEVALHKNITYGLVAPGYEMADALAFNLCGFGAKPKKFIGSDLSAKLKLIGVEAASFGDALGETEHIPIVFRNPRKGIYKRINISLDGKYLLGGILIGDTKSYGSLLSYYLNRILIPEEPETLIVGTVSVENISDADSLPDDAKVCSCNNISKGEIIRAIKEKNCFDMDSLKKTTKAGTGCGGCIPQINSILKKELKNQGRVVTEYICEHFKYSRQELFQIVKIKKFKTFKEVIQNVGTGFGCEICKPTIASILASIYNEPVMNHREIQDTNDKYLGNIQKNGTYSVVPRIPGGEILPEKLEVIAKIAKEFSLYCKITGGQRIDLFGAKIDELPQIWKKLTDEGFESGHAYGKALRTVKSCVGSTWCRFGVQDSVSFAIQVENRYKGLRAPHKLKSAVSGCIRECAEARGKDFGIIATEKGWNLYFGGNGGVNPKHAVLFAEDLDDATCIKYIDRLLMFYIRTADKLMRTSTWLEQLDGGIEYLKDVIINDRLGINSQLEEEMQKIVDSYHCEWKEVVKNPEKQKKFMYFINTNETDQTVRFTEERGQRRPLRSL